MSEYRMEEADEAPEQTEGGDPKANWWAIGGIVCALLSLIIIPVVPALVGIILGIVARRKGSGALAIVAIVLSAVIMLLGIVGVVLLIINGGVPGVGAGVIPPFLF